MTLTNQQIDNLANEYNIPHFECLMNNELVSLPLRDCNYVVNLENDNQEGSHWVSVIVKNGEKVYADSFGCVPTTEVASFLQKTKSKFSFNTWIIQDLKSDNCGLYALGLIVYCNLHPSNKLFENVNNYYKMFNAMKLKNNDKIIKTLFKCKFKGV